MDEAPIQFPLRGIDLARAFVRQTGETTVRAVNVRSFDPLEDRRRGGSRDGLARWIDDVLAGEVQGIGAVAATGEQFVIGYFPFQWPNFVLNPGNFAPVRFGGSGEPQLPGLVPLLAWTPAATSLFEDEVFGLTHYNPTAKDPRDNSALAGTFTFEPPLGEAFGKFAERVAFATFTPDDPTTFRSGQAVFIFKHRRKPTAVVWSPPATDAQGSAIAAILNATGVDKITNGAVAGQVFYDCYYIDPVSGERVVLAPPAAFTFDVLTTYFLRATFKANDLIRYDVSRMSATVLVVGGGGGGAGPPFTFTARSLFAIPDDGFVPHSVVDIRDVLGNIVESDNFVAANDALSTFLTTNGYDGAPTTWAGPVVVSVADPSQLDGGGVVTWAYVYP